MKRANIGRVTKKKIDRKEFSIEKTIAVNITDA
jgi:hypothetical protein